MVTFMDIPKGKRCGFMTYTEQQKKMEFFVIPFLNVLLISDLMITNSLFYEEFL